MKKIIIAAIAIVASCATSAAQIYLWNGGEIKKGFETPGYVDSLTFEHKEKWDEFWYIDYNYENGHYNDVVIKNFNEWNEMHLWKNNKNLYTAWPDSVSFSYINLDKYSTPTTNDLIDKYESAYDPMHWYDWGFGQYNPLNVISGIMTNDFYVGGSNKDDQRYWHKMAGLSADASNNLSSVWEISYEGIMRANAIERLVDDEDYELTDGERKLYKAEANFLRNYYYAIIWKWWGNIPYSKTATRNETLYNAPQCDATTVGDNIAADLETIIESDVLPMRWAKAESGRISKAAAIMLYTDVIMYNTASEKFAENKKKAKDYLLQIVNSGEYSLNPDYAALWEESGEWCAESILEVNYDDNNNKRGWSTPLAKGGTILPTFISPNGWPGGDGWGRWHDGWGFFPMRTSTLHMYKLSDARRDATCWDVRGVEYYERYQDTHIWLKKYRPQSANNADAEFDSNLNYNNNLRIYRYAETLLWLSELTEDAKYMNMVRKRAGLADTDYSLEAVIEERHLEFVGENKRYWDLIRTGMAATELKANVDDIDDREDDWTERDNKYLPIPESAIATAKLYGNALKQNNPCPYDISEILEGSSFKVTKDNSIITLSADCSPLNERYYVVDKNGNEIPVNDGRYICPEAGKYIVRLYANYRDMVNSDDYVERSIDITPADIEADAIYAKDYESVIDVVKNYNIITAKCSDENVTIEMFVSGYDNGSLSYYAHAGDHIIRIYVKSGKGIRSKDYLEYEFTVGEEDLLGDAIDELVDILANKTWRIDNQEYGHLGCGPSGTDGTDWWSAGANVKAEYGVYDDRITFERGDSFGEGMFTYDPGAGGTVYVNHGCQDALFAEATRNGTAYEDVMVEVEKQTSTFAIVTGLYRGETHLYLQLAPKTLMPYISGDEAYNNPLYRIESLTNQMLVLVCDYGEVAWRMVFTSEEEDIYDDSAEMDWDTASSANLWNAVENGDAFISVTPWMSGPGWGGGLEPDWARKDAEYLVTLPEGIGGDQWMGQFHINTTLTASKAKRYNFYCVVEADADAPGVTIKLVETDEGETKHDLNYFFEDRHNIKAFKPFVYKAEFVQLAQNDAHALSLIFDFGGTPEGTTIKISEIYFEEVPDYNDENNLWKSTTPTLEEIYHADGSWTPYGYGSYTYNVTNDLLSLSLNQATEHQWQAQYKINTGITGISKDKKYNFYCKFKSNKDCAGVTIKLCELGPIDVKGSDGIAYDANTLFYAENAVDLVGGKEVGFSMKNQQGIKLQDNPLMIIFDFGGNPENFEVEISEIIIMEVR